MNASEIVIPDGWLSIETLPMDLAMVKLKKPTDLPVAPLPGVNTTAVNGSLFVVEKHKDIDVTAVSEAEYVEHATCNSTFLWTRSLEMSQMCAEATKCISKPLSCASPKNLDHSSTQATLPRPFSSTQMLRAKV